MAAAVTASGAVQVLNLGDVNISLAPPTGFVATEVEIRFLTAGGTGSAANLTPATGTGFTSIGTAAVLNEFGQRAVYRVHAGTPGTVVHSVAASEDVSVGVAFRATGVDTADVLAGTPAVGRTTNGTSPRTLPSITTDEADALIVYCVYHSSASATPVVSGATLLGTFWDLGGTEFCSVYSETQATAGASTARTVSWTGGGSASINYAVFALKPAAAATEPDAPTAVRPADAFGYDSEVGLDWDAPASDGGEAITGYLIERSTNDGGSWSTHTADTGTDATTATLTGLTLGTRYLFRVSAINSVGTGASAVSEWGSTPIADAAPLTPPSATNQTSAPWQLARIDQTGLPVGTTYSYRYTGAGVRIYLLDTGVRITHDEFDTATVSAGFSVAATGAGNDVIAHGTGVASCAVGVTFGPAKEATLISVKVFEDDHNPSIAWPTQANMIACLEWIEANHPGGPAIVSFSGALGDTGTHLDTIVAKVEQMVDDGYVFTIAAGNEGASPSYVPPKMEGVLIVAGSNDTDAIWSDSSRGAHTDVFAPAEDVSFATPTSDSSTSTGSGTSESAPIVAGTLAMWLEANPSLTPRQCKDLVLASSTKDVITGTLGGSPNRLIYTLADLPEGVEDTVVDATPTTVAITTGTANVVPTTEVEGTATAVAITTGTADVVATAEVAGSPTTVAISTAVADVEPTTQVDATPTAVSITTATANVTATADVDGVPTAVAVTTATATVTATADIDGTPTTIVVSTGVADISTAATVDATPTTVSITTGVADVVPTTDVDATATTVTIATGIADITAATVIDGVPTVVAISTGAADIVATTIVDGVPSLVVITSDGANIVPTTVVDGVPTTVSISTGIASLNDTVYPHPTHPATQTLTYASATQATGSVSATQALTAPRQTGAP